MKKIIFILTLFFAFTSCNKLDIAPNNIIQDKDIFSTPSGVAAYMATIYTYLPIEDFRYQVDGGGNSGFGNFFYNKNANMYTGELHQREISNLSAAANNTGYWTDAYLIIRNTTYFIDKLPDYKATYTADQINHWLGEARFLRAYTYFSLVKRYGGVPLITTVATPEEAAAPRASEQAVWDYVCSELNAAAGLMRPASESRGRVNKYIAAGMLSRTALYAGSIAKYNIVNNVDPATGNRVQGIPATETVRYLKMAYNAALTVAGGGYTLYRAVPDKAANFYNLFYDVSSGNKEFMFSREYVFGQSVHQFDLMGIPYQMQVSGSASYECPTLDWVELFDGLPRNADGSLKTLDASTGKFAYYDTPADFFKTAEPRLLASVIVPGSAFKGITVDVRRGIYTGSISNGINPFPGSVAPYPLIANPYTAVTGLTVAINRSGAPTVTLPDGSKMQAGGLSGIFSNPDQGTTTGFHQKKFLDEKLPPGDVKNNYSTTPWPELRYAEVMLNRAEAAYELHMAGQTDVNYVQDAYTLINDIRERGGAVMLPNVAALTNISIIRQERLKELGFESKIFWDQRRWRTADIDINNRTWFSLNPIYVAANGKYIMDKRKMEGNRIFTFNVNWYYVSIPSAEISRNPKIVPNI